MKVQKTLLAACVAGSLFQMASGRGNSQEISQPVQQSRVDSDFGDIKPTQARGARSISAQPNSVLAFRRAAVATPKSSSMIHKAIRNDFSGGRKFAINNTREPALKRRSIASSSLISRRVDDNAETSLKSSKAGSGKSIAPLSIAPDSRVSKFSLNDELRSIRSDIFSQTRNVK